jgi:hypothetical protein
MIRALIAAILLSFPGAALAQDARWIPDTSKAVCPQRYQASEDQAAICDVGQCETQCPEKYRNDVAAQCRAMGPLGCRTLVATPAENSRGNLK